MFWLRKKIHYFCAPITKGTIAQLVEQRTENPCVPGSNPGGTTKNSKDQNTNWELEFIR